MRDKNARSERDVSISAGSSSRSERPVEDPKRLAEALEIRKARGRLRNLPPERKKKPEEV